MSTFHSIVSRRDFMKGLGLAGAGLGAAAVVSPVFNEMDELVESPGARWKRAWFVKHLEHQQPTVEISWKDLVRPDQANLNKTRYDRSPDQTAKNTLANAGSVITSYIQSKFPNWKFDKVSGTNVGTLRDLAMQAGAGALSFASDYPPGFWELMGGAGKTHFLGIQKAKTPEELGLPKWQGTPEENLSMVRQAARAYGATDVGCVELDDNTRRLIFSKGGKACGSDNNPYKPYTFADVDKAVDTDKERIIPNKCKYMIVWTNLQPTELHLREPSALGKSATSLAYSQIPMINVKLQEFIRGLGYTPISGYSGNLSASNPFGVLSGVGEHARMSDIVISPEYGAFLRGMNRILTDLPIAPTNPIDSGIARFCLTCKICAESCPFGALPMGDPSYERPTPADAYVGGFKGWMVDYEKCPFCSACQAICPFNSIQASFVHGVVKATLATTPLFNSFFANMERTFEYGMKDPESWWDLPYEPSHGVDPRLMSNQL